MSVPSSPTGSADAGVHSISTSALAEAAERRTRQATPQLTAAQLAIEHERRQKFRRLVDPGVTRPNPKDKAMSSLKTLLTISENLLRDPENEKYQQFKPTNTVIKRELVDRKGALEFAIEVSRVTLFISLVIPCTHMGDLTPAWVQTRGLFTVLIDDPRMVLNVFPQVKNFQPYYVFHKRHLEDLKIGAAILKDYIATETIKEDRLTRAKKSEKETHEAVAEKVKLAYMDDRKAKLLRDEIEKEQRAGRATAQAQRAALEAARNASAMPDNAMPGSGHVLNDDQEILEE